MPKNQTVWKSSKQGVKEGTFIQTGRRSKEGQLGWRGCATWRWLENLVGKVAVRLGWARQQLADQEVPYLCANNWEEQLGTETVQPRIPVQGNKASKPLTVKICEGWGGRRNSQPHRRVHWRDPQGPGTCTNPPTWESAPEGPNLLVGSGRSDYKRSEKRASDIVPSLTPPPHTMPQRSNQSCPVLANT